MGYGTLRGEDIGDLLASWTCAAAASSALAEDPPRVDLAIAMTTVVRKHLDRIVERLELAGGTGGEYGRRESERRNTEPSRAPAVHSPDGPGGGVVEVPGEFKGLSITGGTVPAVPGADDADDDDDDDDAAAK